MYFSTFYSDICLLNYTYLFPENIEFFLLWIRKKKEFKLSNFQTHLKQKINNSHFETIYYGPKNH